MTEQLTSTEIEFIQRLAEQLKTQDNRGTADPYFVVQEKKLTF